MSNSSRLIGTVFEERTFPVSQIDFIWECVQELNENQDCLDDLPKNCVRWRRNGDLIHKDNDLLRVYVKEGRFGICYVK